ncbi:MAG: type II toxin-antitoxin system VapC family toxin [Chloroflexota bacterium]|nr:type II toxin-antitoxin system VapC family toxin [Chloroflexota bacterium]
MYLLDTNVVSALRRPDRHPGPIGWLQAQRPSDVFLSVVTIGEIERGIAQQQRHDPSFARELSVWLDRVLTWYGDRVLGVDVPTARRWGRLSGDLGHESADLIIAATALEHGLTVATRNTRHFEPAGVEVFNPFWRDGVTTDG